MIDDKSTNLYLPCPIVELSPVCKDDLVCLPRKLAHSLGNISQLVITTRVGNSLHVLDPNTMQTADISSSVYWRAPFMSLTSSKNLVEYYVLDVEPLGPSKGKHVLADVHVARMSDFGRNDNAFIARSHLGALLNPGDTVLGYDLSRSNFNDDNFNALDQNSLTDVVLVRKSYPNRRKKTKARNWKLLQLGKEEEEMLPRKQDQARIENDLEMFMRDLEEDPEMRSTINIFKNEVVQQNKDISMDHDTELEDEEEEDFPEISLEEMLDEMKLQEGEPDEQFEDEDMMM